MFVIDVLKVKVCWF